MLTSETDQSPRAVLEMVKMRFPDEADKLLRGRIRIIKFRSLDHFIKCF